MSSQHVLQRALDRLASAQIKQLLEPSEAATRKVRDAEQLLLSSAEELRLCGIFAMAMALLDEQSQTLFDLTEERLLRERLLSQDMQEYNPTKEFEKAIKKALEASAYRDAVSEAWSYLNYLSIDELQARLRQQSKEEGGKWHHLWLAFNAATNLITATVPFDQRAKTAMTMLWYGADKMTLQTRHVLQDLIHSHLPILAPREQQKIEKQLKKCTWLRGPKQRATVAANNVTESKVAADITDSDVNATITALEDYLRSR